MNKDMKKLLYIAFAILMAAGCGERTVDPGPGPNPDPDPKPTPVDPKPPVKEETLAEKIAGEWHCVVSDIDADIYIKIASDSSFELIRRLETEHIVSTEAHGSLMRRRQSFPESTMTETHGEVHTPSQSARTRIP